MRRRLLVLVTGLLFIGVWYRVFGAQSAAPETDGDDARPPVVDTVVPPGAEAVSLLGRALPPRTRSAGGTQGEVGVEEARRALAETPDLADPHLAWAIELARAGRYREAQEAFARGGALHPDDARFPRHRGEVLLLLRRLDEGLAELRRALELIDGAADVPDLGPAAGDPLVRASLHFAVWYHLGLAHYLRDELEQAALAFNEAIEVAPAPDPHLAATFWQVAVLRHLGLERRIERALAGLDPGSDAASGGTQARLLSLFAGETTEDALADDPDDPLLAFGLGLWHFTEGRRERGFQRWERVVTMEAWDDWGVLAAEAELARPGR